MNTENATPRPFPEREQAEFMQFFRAAWSALSESVSYQLDEIEVSPDEVRVSFLSEDGAPGETFYACPRQFESQGPHGRRSVQGFHLFVEVQMPARGMEPPYTETFVLDEARSAPQAAAALAVLPAKRICSFAIDAENDRQMSAAESAYHTSPGE